MHVIDSHLNEQSEMSAEEMLDEYIDREDKSILDMMNEIPWNSRSKRYSNKHSSENEFNFLGSKINEYNNQLINKLNQDYGKQNNSKSHSWLNNPNSSIIIFINYRKWWFMTWKQ